MGIIHDNSTSPILEFQEQALLNTVVRKGRNFKITYTATVDATGLSINCTAYVCSIAGGEGHKPPGCKPFASSGISRDATVGPT